MYNNIEVIIMDNATQYIQSEISKQKRKTIILLSLFIIFIYVAYEIYFFLFPLAIGLFIIIIITFPTSLSKVKDLVHYKNLLEHQDPIRLLEQEIKVNNEQLTHLKQSNRPINVRHGVNKNINSKDVREIANVENKNRILEELLQRLQ